MVSSPTWQTRLRPRDHTPRWGEVRGGQAVQVPKSRSYLSRRSDSFVLFWSPWRSALICLETLII